MKLPHLTVFLFIGVGIGFLVGRSTVSSQAVRSIDIALERAGQASNTGDNPDIKAQTAGTAPKPEPLTADKLAASLREFQDAKLSGVEIAASWAKLWQDLSVSDLPALASSLVGPGKNDQSKALSSVIYAWSEKDPGAAWNFAQSIGITQQRRYAMASVIRSVCRRDHNLALVLADELKEGNIMMRRWAQSLALETLAHENPRQAFDLLAQRGGLNDRTTLSAVLRQWALKDPVSAQAAAAKLSGQAAETAQRSIIEALGESNPQAAWEYAKGLPRFDNFGHFQNDPQTKAIEIWARSDPEKAIEVARTIQDAATRDNTIASAINSWASSDFDAALAYTLGIPDTGTRGKTLVNLAENDSLQGDPRIMFDALVEHVPPGTIFQDAVSTLLRRWARNDPRQAALAAGKLPASETLSWTVCAILDQWAAAPADRQQVLDWTLKLPEGETREEALETVFRKWGEQDPRMAQQLLASKAGTSKEAFHGLAAGWSRVNAAEAARWAISLPEESVPTTALGGAISSWSYSSPDDVASFIQTAPAKFRPAMTAELVKSWSSRNSEAAAAWIKRQPAGPSKDAAICAISDNIDDEDPETALAWVRSISNQEDRLELSQNILRTWLKNDPSRAKAWIAAASLPAEVRKKLEDRD